MYKYFHFHFRLFIFNVKYIYFCTSLVRMSVFREKGKVYYFISQVKILNMRVFSRINCIRLKCLRKLHFPAAKIRFEWIIFRPEYAFPGRTFFVWTIRLRENTFLTIYFLAKTFFRQNVLRSPPFFTPSQIFRRKSIVEKVLKKRTLSSKSITPSTSI